MYLRSLVCIFWFCFVLVCLLVCCFFALFFVFVFVFDFCFILLFFFIYLECSTPFYGKIRAVHTYVECLI